MLPTDGTKTTLNVTSVCVLF